MDQLARNIVWLALGAALAAPAAALAQTVPEEAPCEGCAQGGGRVPGGGPWHRKYHFDPTSQTTVQGDIVEVETVQGRHGKGVHLMLAVGSETLEAMVGPKFWLDQQSVKLAPGNRIEVKGSRTTIGDEPAMVAQEIREGSDVLALRDAGGVPAWRRGSPG